MFIHRIIPNSKVSQYKCVEWSPMNLTVELIDIDVLVATDKEAWGEQASEWTRDAS